MGKHVQGINKDTPCKTTKQKYGAVVAHDSHQNAYTIDLHHYLLFHKSESIQCYVE